MSYYGSDKELKKKQTSQATRAIYLIALHAALRGGYIPRAGASGCVPMTCVGS